jgi:hypothetical protein
VEKIMKKQTILYLYAIEAEMGMSNRMRMRPTRDMFLVFGDRHQYIDYSTSAPEGDYLEHAAGQFLSAPKTPPVYFNPELAVEFWNGLKESVIADPLNTEIVILSDSDKFSFPVFRKRIEDFLKVPVNFHLVANFVIDKVHKDVLAKLDAARTEYLAKMTASQ